MSRIHVFMESSCAGAFRLDGEPTPTRFDQILEGTIQISNPGQMTSLVRLAKEFMHRQMTVMLKPEKVQPKAIFFDMDATVIRQESIVELARAVGKEAEVAEMTEKAMAGKLSYPESLKARVRLLEGLPTPTVDRVGKGLTLSAGIRELSSRAKERGLKLYLVSGGFRQLADPIADSLGFDACLANQLEVSQGHLTGQVMGDIVDSEAKHDFVCKTMEINGWQADDVAVVGDGANDILMMKAAGLAYGFHPKSILIPYLSGANYLDDHALLGRVLFGP